MHKDGGVKVSNISNALMQESPLPGRQLKVKKTCATGTV